MQEIQFLEFMGESNLMHAHSNYLIGLRFIQINIVTSKSSYQSPSCQKYIIPKFKCFLAGHADPCSCCNALNYTEPTITGSAPNQNPACQELQTWARLGLRDNL